MHMMSGNSALLAMIQTPAASLGYMFAFITPNIILFHFSGRLAIIVKAELEEMGIHFRWIWILTQRLLLPLRTIISSARKTLVLANKSST